MAKSSRTNDAPSICVGRDELCRQVIDSAVESGAVLLFGGRRAGKTTILRKITRDLSSTTGNYNEVCRITLPIYVNLMELPFDATPSDFFEMLFRLAFEACNRQVQDFRLKSLPAHSHSGKTFLDAFIKNIETIIDATGNVEVHFLFLLDEAKRVLFERFPRGFQDNLFTLLFGDTNITACCSMVFAGAQELYRFCEDDTSPIGSRAEKHIIPNLTERSITDLILATRHDCAGEDAERLANLIYSKTGGQAGLTSYINKKLSTIVSPGVSDVETIARAFQIQHSELFQIWASRLSVEAQVIHDYLLQSDKLGFKDVARLLSENGMPPRHSDRVCDEFQFTGIARFDDRMLYLINRMYVDVASTYIVENIGNDAERSVWSLLGELEINMRKLVRKRYEEKWPGGADKQIASCLGKDSWQKALENKAKYESSYPRSIKEETLDILDFVYLGQLGQLITWGNAWEKFKHMFRDRREIEDMLKNITPVRNDSAHFRSVPQKELDRCRISCEDLLVILDKEQNTTDQ